MSPLSHTFSLSLSVSGHACARVLRCMRMHAYLGAGTANDGTNLNNLDASKGGTLSLTDDGRDSGESSAANLRPDRVHSLLRPSIAQSHVPAVPLSVHNFAEFVLLIEAASGTLCLADQLAQSGAGEGSGAVDQITVDDARVKYGEAAFSQPRCMQGGVNAGLRSLCRFQCLRQNAHVAQEQENTPRPLTHESQQQEPATRSSNSPRPNFTPSAHTP